MGIRKMHSGKHVPGWRGESGVMRKYSWILAALVLLAVMVSFPAKESAAGPQARVYCYARTTPTKVTVGKVFFTPADNQGGCHNPIASLNSLRDQCTQHLCREGRFKGKQVWAKVFTFCGYINSDKSICPAD